MISSRLNPADRAAFNEELTRTNFRHIRGLAIAGNVFLWAVYVFLEVHPLPLKAEINFLNGMLCANGLVTLAVMGWFRKRPTRELWHRVLVLENAVMLLGVLNVDFFAMLPAYGITSLYVIGVLVTAVAFRMPPAVLWGLLVVNHAVFLSLLFQTDIGPKIAMSTVVDFSGVVVLAGVIGGLLFRAQEENFRKERTIMERNLELARLHRFELDEKIAAKLAEEKTRLEMLRYQLNPHFLYNALNSIRALIFSRPEAAGEMVTQLADLCRVTLTRNEESSPISEEFAMLRLYLEMEKTRWRDKLAIEIHLAPEAAAQSIPPFLLLPLVENALKHGRQNTSGLMKLRLSARIENNEQVLEVANTGTWVAHGQSIAPSTGIGLENLRQRLKRYYPNAHELTTVEREGWVVVLLRLVLSARPAP